MRLYTGTLMSSILLGTLAIAVAPAIALQAGDTYGPPQPRTGVPSDSSSGARFSCDNRNGRYIVSYLPLSQPGQSYAWATPSNMGRRWDARTRCMAIQQRLESYRVDGLLEMRTAIQNNQNVVCVTTERNSECRIVFTVPRGQDPIATRDRVFENLAQADSGRQTSGVSTYTNTDRHPLEGIIPSGVPNLPGNINPNGNIGTNPRGDGIDLRPFLAPEDGGTGTQLQPTTGNPNPPIAPSTQPRNNTPNGRRLNPDRFR